MSSAAAQHKQWSQRGMFAGILVCVLLTLYALLRYPELFTTQPLAETLLFLAVLIGLLGAYGWAALRPAASPWARWQGALWGLVIGGLWMAELWAGNVADPSLGAMVLVIYRGSILAVPVVTVIASAQAAHQTRQWETGVTIGLWSGFISALITFASLMLITFVFQNAPQNPIPVTQNVSSQVIAAHVADALGAVINHLWIGPAIGLICGAVGGMVGASMPLTSEK